MPAPQARLEIEQTLRASRDSTELRIAWGRMALFGLGLVASIQAGWRSGRHLRRDGQAAG